MNNNNEYLMRRPTSYGKGKSKANLIEAWICPEISRKLRFPDFDTSGI